MHDKIRVLNILSDTNIGGAGRYLINFLKYYDRDRFEITVVLPKGSLLIPEVEAQNTPVIQVDGMGDKSLDLHVIQALKKIIRRERPQIVHTHGALSGRIAGKQAGAKVVFTRHCAFPVSPRIQKGPGRWLNKTLNEHYADQIIAVSPAAAENLTDGGIDPKLIHTMMNGVEPVPRRSPEECQALRQTLQLPDGVFTLGILARLEPYKGHQYVLEAAALLKQQGRDFQILIAGKGEYEQELRALAHQLDVEDRVRFLGFVSDVGGLLSILDVQLNASYGTETSSLSILEGFSMGLPAVVSRYGGNPWLVDEGENGLIFPNRDSAGLAACIARLMDEPETLQRMGQRAEEIYRERFTGEIFARNIEAVYLRTLEGDKHEERNK
jgi:glycosyltransferase involved in cell wall biosynthesis